VGGVNLDICDLILIEISRFNLLRKVCKWRTRKVYFEIWEG
jgi:hypothetical protein